MEEVKFEHKLKQSNSNLSNSRFKTPTRERYEIINTAHLDRILLTGDNDFMQLKSELDSFNEEVRNALNGNKVILSYPWKASLFTSLRSLLIDVASTEEKILRDRFLSRTKKWFYNKMEKKDKAGDLDKSMNTSYTRSTRPVTENSRLLSSVTKRNDQDNSLNISAIPVETESGEQKSFLFEGNSEILPSKFRAEVLQDYELQRRTIHGSVDPPYERILLFERKVPKGILKPITVQRKKENLDSFDQIKPIDAHKNEEAIEDLLSEKGSEGENEKEEGGDEENEEGQEKADDEQGEAEDGEDKPKEEKQEAPGEGQTQDAAAEEVRPKPEVAPPKAKFKPGIVTPAVRVYLNDKQTRKEYKIKDQAIPIEIRSMFTHYVPSENTSQLELEARWRNNLQSKVIQKRERAEFRSHIKQWSHVRGRMEEEIVRKQESYSFGSCYGKRAFHPRAQSALLSPTKLEQTADISQIKDQHNDDDDENFNQSNLQDSKIVIYPETGEKSIKPKIIDVTQLRRKHEALDQSADQQLNTSIEGDVSKLRIQRIKRFYESSLFQSRGVSSDIGEDGAYSGNRPASLSVYDHKNQRTHKPFSDIYKKANGSEITEKQMSIVTEIKKKLAKFRMKVSMKALEGSILPTSGAAANLQINKPCILPEPGRGLLSNPFIKNKEKKKRSKKT